MFGVQEILGIIGGIVAIVGILLATIGVYRVRGKQKWCIPIGFGLFFAGFLAFITSFPQWTMGFSILATLSLVVVAFLAIEVANAREQRHRKDELSKEQRYRDERLLNEIIEWAMDVARLNFKIYNFTEAQILKEPWVERGIGEIVSQFQVVEAKGVYINSIALSSFKVDKKLSKDIKAVNKEIRELVDVSVKRMDGEVTTEAVQEHMNLLRTQIAELLKEVAKIKTRDIRKKEENMSKEGEATGSNEPTLKDIDDHLNQQDKQMARGTYFSGYIFGATLIFIAFGLLAGKYVLTTELSLVTYSIVMLIGGTVLMGFAWYKRH